MEKVKFIIWNYDGHMCRIATSDCRSAIRKISDGACITSLEMLLCEMKKITEELKGRNMQVVFEIIDSGNKSSQRL